MRRTAVVILLFSLFLSVATPTAVQAPASAEASVGRQEGINVIYESASYTFAKEMVFEIAIDGELKEANLYYRIEGELAQHYQRAEIDGGTAKKIIFLRSGEIPPAAEISYYWKLEDVRGYLWRTDEKSFLYLDQKFLWQSLQRGEITIFWYGDNKRFANAVLDQLDQSFDRVEERLGLEQREPIKIVIYRSWYEMGPALSLHEGALVTGAAFNHRTLIFFLWYGWKETLTHELTHLLTHQLMGEPYDYLPFWLSEGLATYAESVSRGLINEPLRLSYLNSTPTQTELVGLAYAQSQSLVTFLIEERGGKEKIGQLLTTMAEGTTVDDALMRSYGFDRQGLEREWREWIGRPLLEPTPSAEEAKAETGNALAAFIELVKNELIGLTITTFLFLAVLFFVMRRSK